LVFLKDTPVCHLSDPFGLFDEPKPKIKNQNRTWGGGGKGGRREDGKHKEGGGAGGQKAGGRAESRRKKAEAEEARGRNVESRFYTFPPNFPNLTLIDGDKLPPE
jgi:hypothetical protein